MGSPLLISTGMLVQDPALTYVIYWRQRHGCDALQNGHAALVIDSSFFCERNPGDFLPPQYSTTEWYVSWLNQGGGSIFQRRGLAHSFADDMELWGGHVVPDPLGLDLRVPTRWAAVRGLDMAAMKDEWDAISGKQGAHWKILDKNCATVVARVLKAGGGDGLATSSRNQLIWWPTDVIRYAKSMVNYVVNTSDSGQPTNQFAPLQLN